MPLYEDRRNAENRIQVSAECVGSIITGSASVAASIISAISQKSSSTGRPVRIAFDGWYGVEWDKLIGYIKAADTECSISRYISINDFFKSADDLKSYKQKFITDDPAFGFVNSSGKVEDLFDHDKIARLRDELETAEGHTVVYGCGAATSLLAGQTDIIVYMDKTRQPILWQMWEGKLAPFGSDVPDPAYGWKEYYYNDYHMLDHQKGYLYDRMDFWVEAINPDNIKLAPISAYHEIIETMLKYPVKEIKIYQPGPWGAYRYRDLFDVPGLECNAWNELAGPELGMIVELGAKADANQIAEHSANQSDNQSDNADANLCANQSANLGAGVVIEMPMLNLMQHQAQFLGSYIAEHYPGLFPMDVWLDDGYFPEKTQIERTAMPIHNHPSTDYVKSHFNEPLGRYETYYICEAYEGARTIMGYKDDADLEEWERLCRASDNLTEIENWSDFCAVWDSNTGDLYLIPPGTAHGHGGNQMVLEMDTCPSVSATEYSFFEYDFARRSWDDNTKTMTAKPMKMHLEHGFDNEKWRRESWVKDHLLAKPRVEKWTKDYQLDRYTTVPEMPFEIERFHFYTKANSDTEGRFAHIVTLTIGKRGAICSKTNPQYRSEIELFQSAIIPATFGEYEIVSTDGGYCEVVLMRWKKG